MVPQIINANGWLQLRFQYQGKRKKLGIGLQDTLENRALASNKAQLLDHDLTFNQLDPTFDKYRVRVLRQSKPKDMYPKGLWAQYVDYRKSQVSKNTLQNGYHSVTAALHDCPYTEANKIKNWLLTNRTVDAARRTLVQLSACYKWAVKSELVDTNPFAGMASDLKSRRQQPIQPFTPNETQQIIVAVEGTRYHAFIQFLFMTGCRTGEARGFTWEQVRSDHLLIDRSISGHSNYKTDTKTHKARKIPLNRQLRSLLESMSRDSELVFNIGSLRFFQTKWQRTLNYLGIPYRSSYQCRHTAATRWIEAGISIPQVAAWLGNSPEITLRHYGGIINKSELPEL